MATRGPKPIGQIFDTETPQVESTVGSRAFAEQMVNALRSKADAAAKSGRQETDGQPSASNRSKKDPPKRPRQLGTDLQPRFPIWPQDKRGISNDMARSALFTVRYTEKRQHFKGQRITSFSNVEILYTGEELRQRDEDVLLQLLHYGRLSPAGEPIEFVANDFIKQLGWTVNSRSYVELCQSIERMKASSLHIMRKEGEMVQGFAGSIVRSFEYQSRGNGLTSAWKVVFEPRIVRLFSPLNYTQIDWGQRLSLPPLAKWLHTFYYTHQRPYPMKVATLQSLCGTSVTETWRFRAGLKKALSLLEAAGFLLSWRIEEGTDLVHVQRNLPALRSQGGEPASA